MERTALGVAIRAVGDSPDAVNAHGMSVMKQRIGAVAGVAALMVLHVGQMSPMDDRCWCFDAVTVNSSTIMGLEGCGVTKGCRAEFNSLHAADAIEAIRLRATRRHVVPRGRVVAETPAPVAALNIDGRPGEADPKLG